MDLLSRAGRIAVCSGWLIAGCSQSAKPAETVAASGGGAQEGTRASAGAQATSVARAGAQAGARAGASAESGPQPGGSAGMSTGGARPQAGDPAAVSGRGAAGRGELDAGAAGADAQPQPDASAADGGDTTSCQRCSAYGTPRQTGSVEPAELNALSGLAASRLQPGIVFAHNDHDRPVVYALDLQGKLHARISLDGAPATDLEDIAVGPCGAQTCVYLADIGDNAAQRSEYAILRFVQPEVPDTAAGSALSPSFERFAFAYEDGSHNAESLLVAPNGTLYIITKLAPGSGGAVKATGPSAVYKLETSALSTSQVARAQKLTSLSVPKAGEAALSAAAAHPCGDGFLVRTYDRVYEFLAPAGTRAGDLEPAFFAQPNELAMPDEPQSEGIDYQASGRGFISSGEGAHAPLFVTECAP